MTERPRDQRGKRLDCGLDARGVESMSAEASSTVHMS